MAPEGMQAANDVTKQHALLLVMADVHIRTAVARYLRRCGLEVLETASANEALLLGESYDAVLADVSGSVDGFALRERIQHLRPNVPVVLSLSHRHLGHDITKLRKHIPQLQTGFDQAELRHRINSSMRRARRRVSVGPDINQQGNVATGWATGSSGSEDECRTPD